MHDATLTPLQPAGTFSPATSNGPAQWGWWHRLAFRFGFSYWTLFALVNGNISLFLIIPGIGRPIQDWITAPGRALAVWLGEHFFHLSGTAARWHGGGSGDTALHYLQALGSGLIAVAATLIWSVLDRRRPNYCVLLSWLRWLLRLTLASVMVYYGLAKLFPLQMRPPSLGILTNTFGNSSPMTLLWTMLGLNPVYQMICGGAEVAAGLLLLIRRTANLGVIVTLALSANIVLYNFFFDVPVKLFALHLLVMSGYLLVPDVPPLWRFFFRRRPTQLLGAWTPFVPTSGWRKGVIIAEIVFAIGMVGQTVFFMNTSWRQHRAAQSPTPIMGAWTVEKIEAESSRSGPVSPEGEPWVALYIDDQRGGFYRSRDGALWRCGFNYNAADRKLSIRAVKFSADYVWELTDSDHLVLSRNVRGQPETIVFRRIDTSGEFPLLERGFRWVNEWGYER